MSGVTVRPLWPLVRGRGRWNSSRGVVSRSMRGGVKCGVRINWHASLSVVRPETEIIEYSEIK